MRKLVHRLMIVGLLATAMVAVPSAAPVQAHDSSAALSCTGYETVAVHTTAGGNLYELRNNTCVGHYNTIPDCCWTVEGITRYNCFRNGASWDGCRVNGNVELQSAPDGVFNSWSVQVSTPFSEPGPSWPCSGESCWFSDSGRISSGHDLDGNWEMQRGKGEGGTARFFLADGSNVVVSVNDNWSPECYCYN